MERKNNKKKSKWHNKKKSSSKKKDIEIKNQKRVEVYKFDKYEY